MTYPSGKVATYTHRSYTGQPLSVTFDGALRASSATYGPHGGLTNLKLGNNRWESRSYNELLQAASVGLGASSGGTDLLGLSYGYGTWNNGNPQSQQIVAPGVNQTQSYDYDGVNRLSSASESGTAWSQTYGYDAFGNRWLVGAPFPIPSTQGSFDAATNRIDIGSVDYDLAGNLTISASGGESLTYDAENHMTAYTKNGEAGNNRAYAYDGNGRRVMATATSTGNRTIFVYDAFGRLAAEYSDAAPAGSGGTFYRTTDPLGSTRAVTDSAGDVVAYSDFMPFGERIGSGVGGRSSLWNATGGFRQQFTAKERDAESGLDYFETRYMSSAQGRFTSPDQPLVDQHAAFPQSWNLYSYVRNNPLKYTDPHGEDCVYTNNYNNDGTVTVERGDCSQKGGTFVNGTIDANSLTVRNGNLEFGYSDPNGGVGVHSMGLPEAPDPGLLALQRAGQIASPVTDPRNIALFYGASAVAGYALVASGAIGGGGLTTLAGEQGVGLVGNQAVNQMISAGQRELLRDMFKTGRIPKEISRQTLKLYKELAERAIAEGKDALGVQAQRLEIIA